MTGNIEFLVLPLEVSQREQRVVNAALTMSHERGRRFSYTTEASDSERIPDVVIVSAHYDRHAIARRIAHRYGEHAPSLMRLLMVDASDAVDHSAGSYRLLTPYGLLESLDRLVSDKVDVSAHGQSPRVETKASKSTVIAHMFGSAGRACKSGKRQAAGNEQTLNASAVTAEFALDMTL